MIKITVVLMICAFMTVNCSNPPIIEPELSSDMESFVSNDSIPAIHLESEILDDANVKPDYDKKIRVLEYRTRYLDSVYFELAGQFKSLEKELNDIKSPASKYASGFSGLNNSEPINDEEYRARYIDALANYQNGIYDVATKEFSQLIAIDQQHELSDNCQYWIGEIYYDQKEFMKALSSFQQVLAFPGANKSDHAQFKIGLCYINLGDTDKAVDAFKLHMINYPSSDQYNSSKKYVEKY